MAASNPNRRCPCGYTRFREGVSSASAAVERWVLFDDTEIGGFGITEFGTFFGAGQGSTYGLFPGTQHVVSKTVTCESCGRVRSAKNLGGAIPFGMYVVDNVAVVVCSDVARPITGYSLSAYEPGGLGFEVQLSYQSGVPGAFIATTPVTTSTTPLGAAADTMLVATILEVVLTGSYLFTFLDNNSGHNTPLATIFLEAPL